MNTEQTSENIFTNIKFQQLHYENNVENTLDFQGLRAIK